MQRTYRRASAHWEKLSSQEPPQLAFAIAAAKVTVEIARPARTPERDTAGDVAGELRAGQSTLGVGAPAAAVARMGANGAGAPLEGCRRIRRTRFGRRLRSHGLA